MRRVEYPFAGDSPLPANIQRGVAAIDLESSRKIHEFFVSGCFVNELHVEYEPPLIEIDDEAGLIVISERLRFI